MFYLINVKLKLENEKKLPTSLFTYILYFRSLALAYSLEARV